MSGQTLSGRRGSAEKNLRCRYMVTQVGELGFDAFTRHSAFHGLPMVGAYMPNMLHISPV